MENTIIAIDGPSAVGKGTISRKIADYYGFEYLDTGIFYRSIAYLTLKNNISLEEENKIIDIAKNLDIIIKRFSVFNKEEEITNLIRSNEVNAIVSQISSIKEIRLIVNDLIRNHVANKNYVIDGRDITSNVYPDARFKFYLDCDADERARRRFKQNQEMGIECSFEEIYDNLKSRDYNDKTKGYGALTITNDAIIINTTNDTIEETIKKIINIIGSEIK